jgi:ribosomal protein RSM22 (predicted rRNA methylase)
MSDPTADDWTRLEDMRDGFLGGRLSAWRDARDLELYDAYFARRIAWKWRAVLGEAAAAGWRPPPGLVVDWGSGSGVAVRELAAAFGAPTEVALVDCSPLAREFARARVLQELPHAQVQTAADAERLEPALLLVSHVLSELDDNALEPLLALALRAEAVLWVEPGERTSARLLSRARERLLERFRVLAPCTHQAACGALAPGAAVDWCHHFARPPAEAFTERHWGLFARRLGIDLRSLPYAYLVLARSGGADAGAARILGRPRVEKGRVLLDACTAEGVRCLRLVARDDPALARRLADAAGERFVLRLHTQGERVRSAEALPPASGSDVPSEPE